MYISVHIETFFFMVHSSSAAMMIEERRFSWKMIFFFLFVRILQAFDLIKVRKNEFSQNRESSRQHQIRTGDGMTYKDENYKIIVKQKKSNTEMPVRKWWHLNTVVIFMRNPWVFFCNNTIFCIFLSAELRQRLWKTAAVFEVTVYLKHIQIW